MSRGSVPAEDGISKPSVLTRCQGHLKIPEAAVRMIYIRDMHLEINGDGKQFADGLSLAGLIDELGMKADRVAVELNREIVPRALWAETVLHDGDKLEIVHFVGGG